MFYGRRLIPGGVHDHHTPQIRKRAPPMKEASSWERFFGRSVAMDLSDEEWKQLSQEYAILPVSWPHERSQSSGSEGDESCADDEDGYSEDSAEFQETCLPSCCERACLSSLQANDIVARQSWLQQMTKRDQDISLLALFVSGKSNKADANKADGEARTRFFYRFDRHHDICRRAFLFIYGIRETRLKR